MPTIVGRPCEAIGSMHSAARKSESSLDRSQAPVDTPGLLLVGHGTRDPAGQAEFVELTSRIRARLPSIPCQACSLEFAEPNIEQGVAQTCRARSDSRDGHAAAAFCGRSCEAGYSRRTGPGLGSPPGNRRQHDGLSGLPPGGDRGSRAGASRRRSRVRLATWSEPTLPIPCC